VSRDSAGRIVLPGEGSQEGRRSDAWKAFVVVACVCPPSLREKVEKAAARKVWACSGASYKSSRCDYSL